MPTDAPDAETQRLLDDTARKKNWKRWGPYLADRQWGTVREDYSADGDCWDYFTHDQSRSRAYRWGEDGLLGITDRECRLCFALALWNDKDPILKERLFGLSNPEGNHGEDVKECYYYLDSTPTHSYMKGLYKYPQQEFPYDHLVEENHRRGKSDPEYELLDTGIFDGGKYFDVQVEYAKAGPDDICIRITAYNRGPERAVLHLLPTLWFRNTWSWGSGNSDESVTGQAGAAPEVAAGAKPKLSKTGPTTIVAEHPTLQKFQLDVQPMSDSQSPQLIFTENETNLATLFEAENYSAFTKDGFHAYVTKGRAAGVNPANRGTKAAAYYALEMPPGSDTTIRLRLRGGDSNLSAAPFGADFNKTFTQRIKEADAFYARHIPATLNEEFRRVARQAYAGLFWSRQFYYYVVSQWLAGDPDQPKPPRGHTHGRNVDWQHVYARDVLSMPDKWEYPWFASWDLGFHLVTGCRLDADSAKHQTLLMLREWYMHPNGQMPAYEFSFGDVNPPVHAWACWRIYKMTAPRGQRDTLYLERCFQKLLLNFTWWVNRKDPDGRNIFAGGFLGLDNIGVFDRSRPMPTGGTLEQADGTAWMAFYCATMLSMSLELAQTNRAYEDIASKFFEHFVSIVNAINTLGGDGLWNEQDGFYYDQLWRDGQATQLQVRSLVGLLPLIAVENIDSSVIDKLPGFKKRTQWFLDNRKDLTRFITYKQPAGGATPLKSPSSRTADEVAAGLQPPNGKASDNTTVMASGAGTATGRYLLAVPGKERLLRVLKYLLDEDEFLSPFGIRSVSKFHRDHPYVFSMDGKEWRVDYEPAESRSSLFGGNSNWRGPIWFPINFLIIEALERYDYFYGAELKVEFPTRSGNMLTLKQVARELGLRLCRIFLPDSAGNRPCHGGDPRYASDPNWKDLLLFNEYFDGDTGRGCGANHQTGWTALVARILSGFGAGGASGGDTTTMQDLLDPLPPPAPDPARQS
jgi:hypothetical protein